ncbi:hypothetical protein BJX63DRAFT_429239 [Aspergillus granulosus]|uniref:Uncharacterized protein n=1 Tax=Aspergillus granulosus TaxID=176169 RepID=A0ABR4HS42_9EURO
MTAAIIDFFAAYILAGRQPPLRTSPTPPTSRIPALEPGGKLFDLVQRVYTIYYESKQGPSPSASTISKAVQIWHELDTWDPDGEDEDLPSDTAILYKIYKSAIFLWTYLVIHPNDVDGWKAQDAVRSILSGVREVHESRAVGRLAIIPLFFAGLAIVSTEDQETVARDFEHLLGFIGEDRVRDVYGIVQRAWALYDAGVRSSWDWMRYDEEES